MLCAAGGWRAIGLPVISQHVVELPPGVRRQARSGRGEVVRDDRIKLWRWKSFGI
jgi:hypothetical protein